MIIGTAQLIRIGVQFCSVIALSRLLSPQDFGLVGCVTPVITFVGLFQDLGYGQAIVQRREISQDQISFIFWITAALGILCASVAAALSPAVAWFFHDSRLVLLTLCASASLLFGSLAAVPSGLLNRRMNYRGLAFTDASAAALALTSAIVSALLGARYWSLIIAAIVANSFTAAGYWTFARWKPGRPTRKFLDKDIGLFGANLTGFTFVNYFSRNLDNVLIGRRLGTAALGYYDRAFKLLSFPIQHLNAPLHSVMTPLLSRVQDDKPRFRAMFLRAAGQLTLFVVPAMAALVSVSDDFVVLAFGQRWAPVSPIFFYLGIVGMVQPLSNATGWILIAQGRTDVMFRLGIVTSLITVGSFFCGLHFGGAVGLAAAYALVEAFLKAPIQYSVLHRVGPVTAGDLCGLEIPLLLSGGFTLATVTLVLRGILAMHGVSLILSAILISFGSAIFITAVRPQGREVLHETVMLFRRLLR
ncbi:lipopolysaccharide biosynthesis protein [Occallatibacter savannae]|uniref:lipopolysaccharide biosynthesis protein n=1 Tax=Occallatibacter savannae TaxID=1002691 RepID=UPI000D693D83|nr:lipopolysaccharide biosynthesis protein [Occallatibacter savannae]